MQRVNEFNFYELAKKIQPIVDLPHEAIKLSDVWITWDGARTALNTIFSLRPLSVSAGAAVKVIEAINALLPEKMDDIIQLLQIPNEADIPPWQVYGIREAAKEFETVLAAECQVLDTYFVSKKGAFSTADLVERAHHHLPLGIRTNLPQLTRDDFDQAGKCIAFDLPTAAAFHLLRGTEAVLRKYYERLVPGTKQGAPKMRNWGVYIKLLSDHGAAPNAISLLTHLKDAYRNPVLHPEETYSEEQALVLFGVCVSAIILMMEEVRKLTPVTTVGPLPIVPIAIT
jgi:hypothetical protein